MKKLKSWFKMGEYDIPTCAREQIVKFFLLAAVILVIGIILTVLSPNVMTIVVTLGLSLVIAGMGYYRLLEISKKGYDRVEGVCERIEYTLISRAGGNITRDIPKRYLIRTEDKTLAIPYFKQNPLIEEKDRVVIYLKKGDELFEWNGIHTPNVIYGYEVLFGHKEKDSN